MRSNEMNINLNMARHVCLHLICILYESLEPYGRMKLFTINGNFYIPIYSNPASLQSVQCGANESEVLSQSGNSYLTLPCATSRRVPGSIPGHWGFFPGHQTIPSALGSIQPLKISTRIFLGVKDGLCVRVTTLSPSCAECLEILEP